MKKRGETCDEENVKKANGQPPLKTREDLWEQVAQVRAKEIVDYFSHTRPNGTSCFTAYEEAGIMYGAAGGTYRTNYCQDFLGNW